MRGGERGEEELDCAVAEKAMLSLKTPSDIIPGMASKNGLWGVGLGVER